MLPRSIISIVIVAYALLAPTPAQAQAASETWVSGTGADTGNCPIAAPCRTFAYAFTQTGNRGSINVLTSGNFGPLTITKSISIIAQGVEAVISSSAGLAAVQIDGDPWTIVTLRGLTIDLNNTDDFGIYFVDGRALHVENTIIRKAHLGIHFAPRSGKRELFVSDTVISDIGIGGGVDVVPSGRASAQVVLNRVRVEKTAGIGIQLRGNGTTGNIDATVRNSVIARNAVNGLYAFQQGQGSTTAMVDRTSSVGNSMHGIIASGPHATIRLSDSTVQGNNFGLLALHGGSIASYGTNRVSGNATDGVPTSTIAHK